MKSGSRSPSTPSFTVTDAVTLPFPHLSGAVDIVCVKQKDGGLLSSPFYVRFGKYQGLLKRREKEVYITVNGVTMPWSMRLGRTGVAYFAPSASQLAADGALSRKSSRDLATTPDPASGASGAEASPPVNMPARPNASAAMVRAGKGIPFVGGSIESLDVNDYSSGSSPEEPSVRDSPLMQMALAEEQKEAILLDRSLSLDSNVDPSMMSPNPFNRNATLDAYEGIDLDKANSLEMHVRKMAQECSSAAVIVNEEDDGDNGAGPDGEGSRRSSASISAALGPQAGSPSEEAAILGAAEVAAAKGSNGGVALDRTLDAIPTSWCAASAAEVRKLLKLSGLKCFKHMEVSHCGNELSNLIVEDEKKVGGGATGAALQPENGATPPVGESGELEMSSGEVDTLFKSKQLSKEDLKKVVASLAGSGGAAGPPGSSSGSSGEGGDASAPLSPVPPPEELVCRVGNVLVKWLDVSGMVMSYLAFQEWPEGCPAHVVPLQPSLPVNLDWNISKATERQEEKWRFFSWLSSSFRTPDKASEKLNGDSGGTPAAAPAGDGNGNGACEGSNGDGVAMAAANGGSKSAPSDIPAGAAPVDVENPPERPALGVPVNAEEESASYSMFTPSKAQLDMLGLKEGRNTVTFSCYSSLWGTQTANAYIYLMPWNSKMVISDVDGTITKSDVLGHVMTAFGRDWSHTGVTKLMKDIRKNGYHVMYLSARSIGQATVTRDFLFNLDQNGAKLPEGPVIISPDGILPSLFREMILKRPDEFKIASLQAIRDLFPSDWNPFYAGFGNRPTDEVSYSAVGIPTSRIFTINPKGQVTLNSASTCKTSQWCTLQGINELVHDIFPEWREDEEDHVNNDEFSEFNYWKRPAPELLLS
mmetsp:Transcript_977/g.2211  ORF Transcript_977/g.2211 Transcript_977/m.2211 type:complete len:873 (-) Transcript_977:722-3340(-)